MKITFSHKTEVEWNRIHQTKGSMNPENSKWCKCSVQRKGREEQVDGKIWTEVPRVLGDHKATGGSQRQDHEARTWQTQLG